MANQPSNLSPLDRWVEENLGEDWQSTLGVISFYGAIALIIIGFLVIPKIQYAQASVSEKCQIDLREQNDEDKFCDSNNKIQSHKAISDAEAKQAEEARRAALTPKQLCEEDHKSGSNPESGN